MRRRTAVLAALAPLATLLVTAPTAVTAAEVTSRPSSGTFELIGHGYGHGRGLSQYGAQGAATKGVSATQILSTYYRNTAQEKLPDRQVRVQITGDEGADVAVLPTAGLRVRDVATGVVYGLPTGPKQWRLVAYADGFGVQYYDTIWHRWGADGQISLRGPLVFEASGLLQLVLPGGTRREYRGTLSAVRTGTTRVATVNELSLEHYLFGVVPREAPASWHAEALKAQAVAARSYSLNKINRAAAGAQWDICDTTACQVYGGVRTISPSGAVTASEQGTTNAAVQATAGIVRTYNGSPILAEFSSSNGGHTAPGSAPYMQANPDPWDGIASKYSSWTVQVPASTIEAKWPALGRLDRLVITKRDGAGDYGGRIEEILLEGTRSDGTATGIRVTGNTFRMTLGLRSTYFKVRTVYDATIVAKSRDGSFLKMPGRDTGTFAVVLRNTGTVAWDSTNVHLAQTPSAAADPMVGGSTTPGVYIRNVTSPSRETVEPGESAEFRVWADVSEMRAGTYTKSYRLRLGNGGLFGQTVTWRVVVTDAVFAAKLVNAQPAAITVPSAGYVRTYVDLVNTGNVDWPVGSGPVRTGTWAMAQSPSALPSWVTPVQPGYVAANLTRNAGVIKPGDRARFLIYLGGNNRAAGRVTETMTILWHGWRWSGVKIPYTYDVSPPPPPAPTATPSPAPPPGG